MVPTGLLFLAASIPAVLSNVAVATIQVDSTRDAPKSNVIAGNITFWHASESDPIQISLNLTGFEPNTTHGIHINRFPIAAGAQNCSTTGSHFNPLFTIHGSPKNSDEWRHVGDLGNIVSDKDGKVVVNLTDSLVSLFGPNPVTGLGFVISEGKDDLGMGTGPASLVNGTSGGNLACGNITIVSAALGAPVHLSLLLLISSALLILA